MNNKERLFVASVLGAVILLVALDLNTDARAGTTTWHLAFECATGVAALLATFVVLSGAFRLQRTLKDELAASAKLRQDAAEWRAKSKRYIEGLSKSIDEQLCAWQLTPAEREVTFLLLKGLSQKEIADVRKTSEKTARAQATSIYAKAGLAGRSELSAYFLEDLLAPCASEPEQSRALVG